MSETVWIQGRYESAYGLLGVMAAELGAELSAAGHDARVIDLAVDPTPEDGVFVFFNAPVNLDAFPAGLWDGRVRGVQVFVDHPFALPDAALDEWAQRGGLENLRVCLPCADDVHLLRMRWPGLKHAWMGHGIPASALCDEAGIGPSAWDAKGFDVVVTGSIAPSGEVDAALERMSPPARRMVQEIIALMTADPKLGYLQAVDLVMGSRSVITGDWKTARAFWRVCVAAVNRTRRLRAVEALQGLRVAVYGPEVWREACTGTIAYAGKVSYEDIPAAFGRGRIGLGWGPTQFVHSYSERIMLAMGAGCASVSDDRLLVRRDFPALCGLYDAGRPDTLRAVCDRMLADPAASIGMTRRARAWVGERCLWRHRAGALLDQAGVLAAV
ncbi:MAG: glycosyltransferase [Phycisphaerales bacterium]|nr:glycosyltransferase [Planctomycetota bacterium]MCH8507393.1 glycosyltransferase [Phycisphaerales bacterium]